MPPPAPRPAAAALTRAAAILNRGRPASQAPPGLLPRMMSSLGQPFAVMFGKSQTKFDQALYDAVRDLSTVLRDMTAENKEMRAAIAELLSVTEPIHCRPGTADAASWRDIAGKDDYQLPPAFLPTDVVLDIGAHIGSFAAACLFRGVGRVFAYEAEIGNYAAAQNNLARFGRRVTLAPQAVWRSDGAGGPVFFAPPQDPRNTGGGGIGGAGLPVNVIALDAVIDEALRLTGQTVIRLLKLDCEGSEYPILLTSRRLDAVQEVCGEYHEPVLPFPGSQVHDFVQYDRQVVKACLERAGFKVELKPHAKNKMIGMFFGKRG